jgi:hypothetical protein
MARAADPGGDPVTMAPRLDTCLRTSREPPRRNGMIEVCFAEHRTAFREATFGQIAHSLQNQFVGHRADQRPGEWPPG